MNAHSLAYLKEGHEVWRDLLEQGEFRIFLDRHQARVVARNAFRSVEVFAWNGKNYFFKWHHRKGVSGLDEWRGAETLRQLGISVARAVAAGRTFFISEAIADAQSVESFLEAAPRARIPRLLLESLAQTVRRMHDARVAHKDLYLGHVFWNSARACLSVIDFARVRRHRLFFWRWRVKDLASLAFSSSLLKVPLRDKIHFYHRYTGRRRMSRLDRIVGTLAERKARRIALHTLRALDRKDRQGTEILEPTAHNSCERVGSIG